MSDSDDFDFNDIGGSFYPSYKSSAVYTPEDTLSELREELNIISKKTAELSKSMIDYKQEMAALTTDFKRDLAALKDFIEAMSGGKLE